jgi:hypothetical protein
MGRRMYEIVAADLSVGEKKQHRNVTAYETINKHFKIALHRPCICTTALSNRHVLVVVNEQYRRRHWLKWHGLWNRLHCIHDDAACFAL